MRRRTRLIPGRIAIVLFGAIGGLLLIVFGVAGWLQHQATRTWSDAIEYSDSGRLEEAEGMFEEALPRLQNHAGFLRDYAAHLRKAGKFLRSVELLERAVKIKAYPFLLEMLADSYAEVGDLKQAAATAERAAAILPWRLTSRFQVADYQERAGNPVEAFRWAREVVLIPMKVPSQKGIELKERSRQMLSRTAVAVSKDRDWVEGLEGVPEAYRGRLEVALAVAGDKAAGWKEMLAGLAGEQRAAAAFLVGYMPEPDLLGLEPHFLREDIQLAFRAKESFLYDPGIPEDVFLNYVLPYAQASETREGWRRMLADECFPLVAGARTAGEAALKLNAELWKMLGVSYGTVTGEGMYRSPAESMAAGLADCVGGSILLADACRAVGVPARLVSVPGWANVSGGHMWVEVWESGLWRSIGAFDQEELDRNWFIGRAAEPDPTDSDSWVYAATFDRQGTLLRTGGEGVYWQNVTGAYRQKWREFEASLPAPVNQPAIPTQPPD